MNISLCSLLRGSLSCAVILAAVQTGLAAEGQHAKIALTGEIDRFSRTPYGDIYPAGISSSGAVTFYPKNVNGERNR